MRTVEVPKALREAFGDEHWAMALVGIAVSGQARAESFAFQG